MKNPLYIFRGLPPEYRDTPDHVIHVTPRCSRHAAAAHARDREKFVDSYNSSSTHELIRNGKGNNKITAYNTLKYRSEILKGTFSTWFLDKENESIFE